MITSPQFRESPETTKLQGWPATMGAGFVGAGGMTPEVFVEHRQLQPNRKTERHAIERAVKVFAI